MSSTRALVVLVVALVAGCVGRGRGPETSAPREAAAGEAAGDAEPGAAQVPDRAAAELEARAALMPVPATAPNFMARQKLIGRYGEREFRAEVIIQKQGEKLVLIGLSPFGTKGFVLEQTGVEVEYTSHMPEGRELPFPPVFMLVDVHRSIWLSGQGTAKPDGEHTSERGDYRVTDDWRGGLIRAREISPAGEGAAPEVSIEFPEGARYGVPPSKQLLRHHRYGYSVEVETVQHQPI